MRHLLSVTAVVLGFALPAVAQEPNPLLQHHQLAVGTGVLGYFSGGAPGTGGTWDVRYAYTPIPFVSVEAGYVGAASEAAFAGSTVVTILEGDGRFNPLPGARLSPYALVGVGWGAFSGTETHSDNGTVVVPFGVGADYALNDRWGVGGRFTYRLTANDHIGDNQVSADNWQMVARLAAQF